jgi:cbb3-type cytochrome oxidase maturation protein
MTILTLCLLLGGLFMGLAGGLAYVLAVRTGQLDDPEEAKYQMLRGNSDDE